MESKRIVKRRRIFDMKHEDMPIGMLIHHVGRTHIAGLHSSLEGYGIQRTYGPILKELSMSEGMTQKALAAEMGITAPSMSVNLQKMEGAGFLTRKTDSTDMRQIRLFLTEKGKETAEKAEREIALANERLVEALTREEQAELKRLLIKILDSLSEGCGEE